jgi:hypothetical protein
MQKQHIKLGFLAIAILEIISIFYMLNIYNKLVSNSENYYKNILVQQSAKEKTLE